MMFESVTPVFNTDCEVAEKYGKYFPWVSCIFKFEQLPICDEFSACPTLMLRILRVLYSTCILPILSRSFFLFYSKPEISFDIEDFLVQLSKA